MPRIPELKRNQRLPDAQRKKIGAELLKRYETGQSVREICAETGYSIGRVRRLLEEAGVKFRSRGGTSRASRVQRT